MKYKLTIDHVYSDSPEAFILSEDELYEKLDDLDFTNDQTRWLIRNGRLDIVGERYTLEIEGPINAQTNTR